MFGSVSRKCRFGVAVPVTATLSGAASVSTAYRPADGLTPSMVANLRRRMSASTSSTCLPDVAMAWARFTDTVDLPSLGTELVMTMDLMGSSTDMKRMFANSVFAAFWISSWFDDCFFFLATALPS